VKELRLIFCLSALYVPSNTISVFNSLLGNSTSSLVERLLTKSPSGAWIVSFEIVKLPDGSAYDCLSPFT
jgi:hypothetical protein